MNWYKLDAIHDTLNHLRDEGITEAPLPALDTSPAAGVEEEYVTCLREERGLSEHSILVYRPHARALLSTIAAVAKGAALQHLGAHEVRQFLSVRVAGGC